MFKSLQINVLILATAALSFIGFGARAQGLLALAGSPAPASYAAPTAESPAAPATVLLRGRVLSPTGVLPGAVVKLTATSQRTVTNANGEFNLALPADGSPQPATVSFAGFADEAVLLSARNATTTVTLTRRQVIKVKRSQRLKVYLRTARRQARKSSRHV